jgi:hypothetical protein
VFAATNIDRQNNKTLATTLLTIEFYLEGLIGVFQVLA